MALRVHRPYTHWLLEPPHNQAKGCEWYAESASVPFILETLGTHAEIASVGRGRFPGTIAQKNALWHHFRNYMRQALSNFGAAQGVPNRSAGLLYYYAALNFAKAELLDTHAAALVDQRIGHGLSFNPTKAKTVGGDVVTVTKGVFPLLYQRRTGAVLPLGTRLPIRRLLQQVPEIGAQIDAVGLGPSHVGGLIQMLARDDKEAWVLLAIPDPNPLKLFGGETAKLVNRHFEEVERPAQWRDHFGLSRRYQWNISFYESRRKVATGPNGAFPNLVRDLVLDIGEVLGMRSDEDWDAWLAPSLYKSRMLPMPPCLARYALTYYASSLVRYKPQMFDAATHPEQAYMFDAVSRELALPILNDVLAAILDHPVFFYRTGGMRL